MIPSPKATRAVSARASSVVCRPPPGAGRIEAGRTADSALSAGNCSPYPPLPTHESGSLDAA
jgi:hypothetical protein